MTLIALIEKTATSQSISRAVAVIERISAIGSDRAERRQEARTVRLTNLLALFFAVMVVPFCPLVAYAGFPRPALEGILFSAVMLQVLTLNSFGLFASARFVLLVVANLLLLRFSLFWGKEAHVHWLYATTVVTPIIVTPDLRLKSLITLTVGFFMPIFGFLVIDGNPPPLQVMPDWAFQIYKILMIATLIITSGVQQFYWLVSSFKTDEIIDASFDLLRTVSDNVPVLIWMTDDQGKGIYFNKVWTEFTGRSSEKESGDLWLECVHQEDLVKFRNDLTAGWARRAPFEVHFRMRRSDGAYRWLLARSVPRVSAFGEFKGFIGSCTDVTEALDLSTKLRESRDRLDLVMKAMKFGVWDWDYKNNRLDWDDYMFELFDYPRGDFTGTFADFAKNVLPADGLRVKEVLEQTFAKHGDFEAEFDIQTRDHSIRRIRAVAKCFYDSKGEIERLVGANWDVTAAREAEARLLQASKMSSLGEMAAGIAHEINNPLAIIKGKAQQIRAAGRREQISPTDIIASAELIDRTADRVARIISGLRSFARDGEHDPMESASISAICEDILAFCRIRFASHGVDLVVDAPDRSLKLDCRPTQVGQVILNLLNNAFDAVSNLETRWVRLTIGDLQDIIEISVTDSGAGIAPIVREKMMQPFFTTKAVGVGTGLGLSISLGIARAHGGTLTIDPTSPNTRFVLRLPKAAGSEIKEAV